MASTTTRYPNAPSWPHGYRAAFTFTIDNMGEAAFLNRKTWPESEPIGNHYSVKEVLPKMLDLLDRYGFHDSPNDGDSKRKGIKATYFIESWNLSVYPDAIVEVRKRGHEVAWHAFQHEAWSKTYEGHPEDERDNFQRSCNAFASFDFKDTASGKSTGNKYKGFRPPGGVKNDGVTLPLLQEYGFDYISPAAEEAALLSPSIQGSTNSNPSPSNHGTTTNSNSNRLVVLPFRWRNIDAYYYMDAFQGIRKLKADPQPSSISAEKELTSRYLRSIDEVVESGGYISTLFHPFLTDTDERMHCIEVVLKHLEKLQLEGKLWVATCEEVAEWIREHEDEWEGKEDPVWDLSSWS